MPEINDQKITRELCQTKDLLFFPKTEEEAVFIQKKLFELGCKWGDGDRKVSHAAECAAQGIASRKGLIYHGPDSTKPGVICNAGQFGEAYLSADQSFMLDLFNKLSTRLGQIEARLDGIEAELAPDRLDKAPRLKTPGGAGR